MVEKSTIRTI